MEGFDPEHLVYVAKGALYFRKKIKAAGFDIETNDLISEFSITLSKCLKSYDPDSGVKFKTYLFSAFSNTYKNILRDLTNERKFWRERANFYLLSTSEEELHEQSSNEPQRSKRIPRKMRGRSGIRSKNSRLSGIFLQWFHTFSMAIYVAKAESLGNPRKDVRQAIEYGEMALMDWLCEFTPKQAWKRIEEMEAALRKGQDEFDFDFFVAPELPDGFSLL